MSDLERERKWLVYSLVAVALVVGAVAAFAVGYAVGRDSSGEPSTVGEQLEEWTECLRDAGVDVPVVEAHRDGGFTITVSGSLLAEFDPRALAEAARQCEPPGGLLGVFGGIGFRPVDPGRNLPPGLAGDLGRGQLMELCEQLAHTDRVPEDLPRFILDACGLQDR